MNPAPHPSRSCTRRFRWSAVVMLAIALSGAACGRHDRNETATTTPTGSPVTTTTQVTGAITVLAAASLTDAFIDLGQAFEAANPGSQVIFSFGASSTLATQANQGAPADVFASADEANMQKVTDAGTAADPTPFARNRLSILVARGNPKGIKALADLGRSGVTFVLCAPEVPCGRFGRQALDKAGVGATPRSYEENVKAVVTKVTLGEVDAGIVYVTDAQAAGDKAEGVDIPDEDNVVAVYPLAVLEQASNPDMAAAFKAYVLSVAGRQIMTRYGFLPPQ